MKISRLLVNFVRKCTYVLFYLLFKCQKSAVGVIKVQIHCNPPITKMSGQKIVNKSGNFGKKISTKNIKNTNLCLTINYDHFFLNVT
jgi:hypothetical protein